MLRSVARRGDRPQADVPGRDLVPGVDSVLSSLSSVRGTVRPGAGRAGEAYAARYMVSVVVGIDDVDDPQLLDAGQLEVLLNVPAGINDDRFAAIPEHVRGAAEIAVEHLSKEQSQPPSTERH